MLYAGYIFLVSMIKPSAVPALPKEARTLGSGVSGLIVLTIAATAIAYLLSHYYLPARSPKGNENIIAARSASWSSTSSP